MHSYFVKTKNINFISIFHSLIKTENCTIIFIKVVYMTANYASVLKMMQEDKIQFRLQFGEWKKGPFWGINLSTNTTLNGPLIAK